MSWQEEFGAAVRGLAVRKGHVVYTPSYSEYDARKHLLTCKPDTSRGDIHDAKWTGQWSTFDSGTEVTGIEADISCVCGEMRNVPFRVEIGFGELVNELTREGAQ